MVKAYLRYEPAESLGVISSASTISYGPDGSTLITAALEKIHVWGVRSGELVKTLTSASSDARPAEVTQLALSPDGRQLASGYSDGTLRLWDFESGEPEQHASGHRSGVSALCYSQAGALLASGGQDTDVVVWDVTSGTPLYRLQGHLGQVTALVFLENDSVLVSCSKDGYIRAWSLQTQHCFQTLGGQHGEVWGLAVSSQGSRVVAAYSTPQLEVLQVMSGASQDTDHSAGILQSLGLVKRTTNDRAAMVSFSPDGRLLACLGSSKVVELFRLRSEAEAAQKLKRRKKRKREKLAKDQETDGIAEDTAATEDTITATDELGDVQVLRCKSKVKSIQFYPKRGKRELAQLALALSNNSLEVWGVGETECQQLHCIDSQGHRSGIRAIALSSDNTLLLSAAEGSVKIWNTRTFARLRHIDIGSGLSAAFAPGNRHAIIGSKEGILSVIDVGSGEIVSSVEAHKGAIWAITSLPDNSGIITGSADHEAKFWEWEVREEAQEGAQPRRVLGLCNTRTCRMSDDVLAVRITPDGRLLALALLDSTVQILFMDSLKLKGSLYGHKLPVLAMDISSDGTLLVTASADKNIKVWGLDFNDCHKSIFAHQDSVMQVAFVPNTHYVFTVGKDRMLKYWDMDRWELLLDLPGHHAEVWCLAVSTLGDMVVTGSADRSIRVWERTDEPFFAEEEREGRLESLFESDQPNPHIQQKREETDGPAEAKAELAGLDTPAARDAMGALADALDLAARENARLEEFAASHLGQGSQKAVANPLFMGMTPAQYVLAALEKVRPAEMEQALLLLPFNYALNLLEYLCYWLEKGLKVELSCRVAVLLVRLHHRQIVATPSVRSSIAKVKELLHKQMNRKKDMMGFNLAGTNQLLQTIRAQRAIA